MKTQPYTRAASLPQILAERIVVLDGAMGTMIQRYKLGEDDYRGERFKDHAKSLKGNNDLLQLTRPDVIAEIHSRYLQAGADIVETNTFGATSVAQADYGLESVAREINVVGARLAREACDRFSSADKPRFVAGALGPTPRTASISPDVNDPAARNVSFDELRDAYREQASGLLEGGCDLFLVETIFDTLNAKVAAMAAREAAQASGREVPLMLSFTVTDMSGRNLSGHTVEAFWHAVRHTRPLAVGLNCSFGPETLRPYLSALSAISDTLILAYPNAGLPNDLGEYDETPETTAGLTALWATGGKVNALGGCCGSTPEHVAAIARAVEDVAPRIPPRIGPQMRLAGLEPFTIAA